MLQRNETKPSQYQLKKRDLKPAEIQLLIREIKKSANISAYSARDWRRCKNIFVVENEAGDLAGACFNDDFSREWTEIAVLFVLEEHREKGLCTALMAESLRDLRLRNRNVLIMTRNPYVKKLIAKFDFQTSADLGSASFLSKKQRFLLTKWYTIRWLCNTYRIYELIRKRFRFGPKEPYLYGLILAKNTKVGIQHESTPSINQTLGI